MSSLVPPKWPSVQYQAILCIDSKLPSSVYSTLCNKYDEKIKEQNITIILTGMLSPPSYGAQFSKKFNNIYPDLARKYKVTLYPFLLEGVALKPELNLKDGKHPNIEGVKIIAQNLYPYILKEIENLKGL